MRTVILFLTAWLLLCWQADAQQLTAAEYFLDSDPGVGNATPVPVNAGDVATASFSVPGNGIPEGFHTLSTRFKDANGTWGIAASRLFYVYAGNGGGVNPAPSIAAGEYFIDTDPGTGAATPFSVAQNDQVTAAFSVDGTGLLEGFHTMSVRLKNTEGAWGIAASRLFYVYGGNGGGVNPAPSIAAGEYFIDTDPGTGAATAFSVAQNDQVTAAFSVDGNGLLEGFHTMSVRLKDTEGTWGIAVSRLFYVYGGNGGGVNPASPIAAAEYFFDVDPGTGNGTALPTGTPQNTVSLNTVIDASALPMGTHVLNIRFKDTDGRWGIAEARPFIVCTMDGPLAAFGVVKDNMAVSFTNQSQNQISCLWNFGDGTTSVLTEPFHEYVQPGVYNVCLVAYNPCLVMGDTICQAVAISGLTEVTPNDLSNTGNFILDVTGAGLIGLQDLRLVRNGQPDLLPDSVIVSNDVLARASFTFAGAADGLWSMQGVLAGGDTVVLQEIVRLSPPVEPDLWMNIAGDGVLRVGFSQVYTVTIGNDGNMDAYLPTVYLENLPIGTEFVFLDSLYGGESVSAYDTLGIDWSEVRHLNLVDSTTMTSFFPFQIWRVPAHGVVSIGVIFHIPDTTVLHSFYDIRAMVTGPAYTSAESQGFRSTSTCLKDLAMGAMSLVIESIGELSPVAGCVTGAISLLDAAYGAFAGDTDFSSFGGIISVPGILSGFVQTTANCVVAFGGPAIAAPVALAGALLAEKKLVKVGNAAISVLDALGSGLSIGDDCFNNGPAAPVVDAVMNVIIGNAWDPNEKYGPGGGSHGQYMNAGRTWPYTIGFENDPAANLPAQTVTVIDSLDLSRFDVRSFGFTSVTIGNHSIGLNGKPRSFIRDFNMMESMGVNVRVTATCDTVTGVVRWVFNTIDPATGQITANALDGFLPPDTLSPNGQGYVSFVVDLLADVADADSVHNRATIIFDFNAPIVTNTWQNVLDRVPPTSQVNPLPAFIAGDSVLLHWSGQDLLSGVRYYTIHVEEGNNGYVPWLVNTSDTVAWFHGTIGSEYRFYSLATDSAGNVESIPAHYDAVTEMLDPDGIGEYDGGSLGFTMVPNPNSGQFELRVRSTDRCRSTLLITNMLGVPVFQKDLFLNIGRTSLPIDLPSIASGLYLINLRTDEGSLNLRWVKK